MGNILQHHLHHYVERFNKLDEEIYKQKYDNAHAMEWMQNNIPPLDCPDKTIEEIYYFRWWTFRKHFMDTPEGVLISEFLPQVEWSGAYNTINCASGFHIREGRWLRNSRDFIENYIRFWLKGSGSGHSYSSWLIWATWEYCVTTGRKEFGIELLPELTADYEKWERELYNPAIGLFWSIDDRDAMEMSISGSGYRPTLNSYMYAGAVAIGRIAQWAGAESLKKTFEEKAGRLRGQIQSLLWDNDFFKVIPADTYGEDQVETDFAKIDPLRNAKELIGYIPWYFGLPEKGKGYEKAFAYLRDEKVFCGKTGLRTADASHPRYRYKMEHECLWNGPSWPFATAQTLVGAANVADDSKQNYFSAADYFGLLKQYAESHYLKKDEGTIIPWIDEDQDPENGVWIAREILKNNGWKQNKGGYERGKDYNHSVFCDLIISGMLGICIDEAGNISANPKFPMEGPEAWEYCMLDKVPLGNSLYRIQYDKTGARYQNGQGLKIIKLNLEYNYH